MAEVKAKAGGQQQHRTSKPAPARPHIIDAKRKRKRPHYSYSEGEWGTQHQQARRM